MRHDQASSPELELADLGAHLAQIARALSQGQARGWVKGAELAEEAARAAGQERLAVRCRRLAEVRDAEDTSIAELIFEGIAQEYARVQVLGTAA